MTQVVILSRRNILHPLAGGAGRYVHEIFRRLANRYDVTVLSEGSKTIRPHEEIDGIDYVNLSGPFLRFQIPLRFLRKYARKTDVLIDHADVAIPWFSPLMPRAVKITIIHQIVREIFYYELQRPWADIAFMAEPSLYRLYSRSRIVASTKSTAEELIGLGIPRQNLTVITPAFSGNPCQKASLDERTQTVSCVGRLVRYKGLQYALRAFRRVLTKNPKVRMKIAGSGRYEHELQMITKDLGIADNVQFLGRIPEQSKFELFAESRGAVVPSVRDGFGIAVLEANSVGTPVVGWDVPGIRDSIAHNATGILAPFPNEKAFADGLETLLTDDATWTRLSENAWREATKHSWDRSASEFQRVIETSLSN